MSLSLRAAALMLTLSALSAWSQDPPPAASPAGEDMVPIDLQLPQASFSGTPIAYFSPKLEEKSFKKRPPFLAPKGTLSVATGKPVTSSTAPSHGELKQITDGNKDFGKQNLVELPAGPQWVQVDLGAVHTLRAVVVWHYHDGDQVYFDVVVQASEDPEFKTGVITLYNNDYDNSAGLGIGEDNEYWETYQGRLIDAKGATGRHLRLYSQGNTTNDLNHYVEVEVFAQPK